METQSILCYEVVPSLCHDDLVCTFIGSRYDNQIEGTGLLSEQGYIQILLGVQLGKIFVIACVNELFVVLASCGCILAIEIKCKFPIIGDIL